MKLILEIQEKDREFLDEFKKRGYSYDRSYANDAFRHKYKAELSRLMKLNILESQHGAEGSYVKYGLTELGEEVLANFNIRNPKSSVVVNIGTNHGDITM